MHILYTLSRSHRNFTCFFCSISLFFNSRNYKVNSSAKPYKVNIEIPIKLNIVNFEEVCNGGVACSRLQLGSLEKIVGASLIPLCFILRQLFFVEKMMAYVMLVNHCTSKGCVIFSTKKTNIFL